jgi:NADH:ubiquinone oxidoreductase subunit 6 (subunit J)
MIPLIVIFAVLLLAAAIAMTLRNLIHSAMLLTLNWMGIAALYLWAGAEFVAFAQVLIYVGAVSMIVLFAVLLTRQKREGDTTRITMTAWSRGTAGVLTAILVAGILCGASLSTEFDGGAPEAPALTVQQIGEQLMGPQVAALLVVGALLTVALIGAVILAAPERREGGE